MLRDGTRQIRSKQHRERTVNVSSLFIIEEKKRHTKLKSFPKAVPIKKYIAKPIV